MRGGRRKDPRLQVLEGKRKPSADKSPKPEPVTQKNQFPVPRGLPKEARAFISRYNDQLIRNNVLKTWDWDSFICMALLSAEIRRHTMELAKEGDMIEGRQGGIVKNPRSSLLRSAQREFRLFCNEFGLTPRGRAGLDIRIIDDDDGLPYGNRIKDLID